MVILDTETTGIEDNDEVVELGIVSDKGETLYEGLFSPTVPMNPEASAVSGITPEMLEGQPTFGEKLPEIMKILEGEKIMCYNTAFDRYKMIHTAYVFGGARKMKEAFQDCGDIMVDFVKWAGLTHTPGEYNPPVDKWIVPKQEEARYIIGITKPGEIQSHRADQDCLDALQLHNAMKTMTPPDRVTLVKKLQEMAEMAEDPETAQKKARKAQKWAKLIPYSELYSEHHMSMREAADFRGEKLDLARDGFFETAISEKNIETLEKFIGHPEQADEIRRQLKSRQGNVNAVQREMRFSGVTKNEVRAVAAIDEIRSGKAKEAPKKGREEFEIER